MILILVHLWLKFLSFNLLHLGLQLPLKILMTQKKWRFEKVLVVKLWKVLLRIESFLLDHEYFQCHFRFYGELIWFFTVKLNSHLQLFQRWSRNKKWEDLSRKLGFYLEKLKFEVFLGMDFQLFWFFSRCPQCKFFL